MNNEIAPVLDMLEELKQECKFISKAQTELRTTLTEQSTCTNAERTTMQETVQIHLSQRDASQNQGASTFCFGGAIAVKQEVRLKI